MKHKPNIYRNQQNDVMGVFVSQPFIHYNTEAEEAVLGACLLEPLAFSRVFGILEPQHFYNQFNQQVFEAISALYHEGQPIDLIISISQYVKMFGPAHEGQNAYFLMTQLCSNVTTSAHMETHAGLIRQCYLERELMKIQATAGTGEEDPVEKAIRVQELIKGALSIHAQDDWLDMSQVMMELHKHVDRVREKDMLGIMSGMYSVDAVTGGWQEGQMVIVGARPGVGKTAFAVTIAVNAANMGHKVGVISLEMPETQIGGRIAAIYSDEEFWRIYRGKYTSQAHEEMIYNKMAELSGLPIRISTKTNVTATHIRAKAEKLKRQQGVDLLIIDYLQLIEGEGKASEQREREIAKMSRNIKLMAMELKIPVIVLCQLNREAAKNDRPKMENLRESGSLEQDADIVILLHREFMKGNKQGAMGESTENEAEVIVEKNRNGQTAIIKLNYNGGSMKFYENAPQWPQDAQISPKAHTEGIRHAAQQNTPENRPNFDFSNDGQEMPF